MTRALTSTVFALALAACSVSPELDPEGGTTTTPGSSSSTSSTTLADSGETSETETSETEPTPDVPEAPVPCDVWLQDCPEHEKCVPYASSGGTWDAYKCVPILGDGQLEDPCIYGGKVDATDDCGAGLMCWTAIDADGQLVGQCAALCEGDSEGPICAQQGTSCLDPWVISDAPAVCGQNCDVLAQDCPDGVACVLSTFSDSGSGGACASSQGVAVGQPCEFFDDCEAGSMCVWNGVQPSCAGAKCCAAFCDPTAPVCTTPGTECMPIFDEGIGWGYDDAGICIEPDAP